MPLKADWVDGDTAPTQHATAHNDAASNINTLVAKAPVFYILPADLTLNNTGTFSGTYTAMSVSLAATSTYLIEGMFIYDVSETADARCRFDMTNAPTTFGLNAAALTTAATAGGFTASVQQKVRSYNANFVVGGAGAGSANTVAMPYKGVILTNAATVFTFQYTQGTAEVSDMVARAGSYFSVKLI